MSQTIQSQHFSNRNSNIFHFNQHRGKNRAWSEEQEEELRQLFMRNQENPETDQDVIDWIVENLKDRTRTRRGVIKKLKELGLIFKAPTKKSTAASVNKNLFMQEEDDKLRELYDEHRLDKKCLAKIMEVFKGKRSKKVIIKRMVQLHLIADESEILPPKKARKERTEEGGDSDDDARRSSDSESDGDESDSNSTRVKNYSRSSMSMSRSNYQISQRDVTNYRIELEESLKEAFEWIIESLKEAADDFEEVSDDITDAIPIVPFSESQKQALENPQFQGLLRSINLIEPHDGETYWKIPANMIPNDLLKRAQLLAGEIPTESQHDTAKSDSENDNDDDSDFFSRLRAQHNALVYNKSDNEDDRPKPAAVSKKTKAKDSPQKNQQKVSKLNTKLIKKIHPQLTVEHEATMQWLVDIFDEKITNKASKSDLIDEMLIVPSTDEQKESLEDENFQKLLTALSLIPPNGIESHWQIPKSLTVKELKKRVELLKVKSTQQNEAVTTEDESDSEQMIIKRKKPKNNKKMAEKKKESQDDEDDDVGINTQQLKERLAELESSTDDDDDDDGDKNGTDMNQSTGHKPKIINRHILDSSSSDDENDGGYKNDVEMSVKQYQPNETKRKSEKRERSQSPDENEMNASNSNQLKKIRRIIDSDDDD